MVYTKWRKGINGKSNVKNKILFGGKHRMRSLEPKHILGSSGFGSDKVCHLSFGL